MIMKSSLKYALIIILILILGGCLPAASDSDALCSERNLPFCVDFESLSGDLGGSQLMKTSLDGRWQVTGDNDREFLFEDFPVDGRSREKMILLGDGVYKSQESSLLYTAEIDLENVEAASLSYSLIYRTEKHWDGLVVFAILGGENYVGDGENWIVLTPENGYPDTVMIGGKLFPGYSGIRSTWLQERIDLTPALGTRVVLGFYFTSDSLQEDWGVALDDIFIESSSGFTLSPIGPTIDLTELELDLVEISYLTPIIPRTNVTADSPCEGSSEVLMNGQRAYTKGINETSDRVLVLHPTTEQYCWVSLENAWIDGDMRELTRISDLKPEDFFLPICAASFAPVISETNCSELTGRIDSQYDLYPYQIQSAVVDEGMITRVVLYPSGEAINDDPWISLEDFTLDNDIYSPPGGLFWAEQGDEKYPCSLVLDQTGSVICGGMSFNAAGPTEFNLCWYGYDDSRQCPPGFGYYSDDCILINDMTSCQPDCPAGYQFNELMGICTLERNPDLIEEDPDLCPAGMAVFSEINCCAEDSHDSPALCPAGYYFLAEQAHCQKLPEGNKCPEGYSFNSQTGECYLISITAAPRCSSLTAEFPVYDISVREATKCYRAPDNLSEIVGTLAPFTVVEVIGLGEDGETLMVQNPEYQVPCWASLWDFYFEDIDLGRLPVITD